MLPIARQRRMVYRQMLPGVLLILLCFTQRIALCVVAHPTLVECVCNTTRASDAVVSSPVSASKGQAAKFVLPSCVEDVFAETGIRWYVNGPVSGSVAYWRKEPRVYTSGRAAQRLISLGYACVATELFDPNEIVYLT